MFATTDLEIRDHLARYLAGELSFVKLEDWLIDETWENAPGETPGVASRVSLLFAEFTGGHLTKAELREELLPFASRYVVEAGEPREFHVTTLAGAGLADRSAEAACA